MVCWHKKIQAHKEPYQAFLKLPPNIEQAFQIGAELLSITRALNLLITTATRSLGKDTRKSNSTLKMSNTSNAIEIDARKLKRIANLSDGKQVLDYILENQNPIEIINLPFESLQSEKNHHPQGKNIKKKHFCDPRRYFRTSSL
jgi:hypothetical protein